MKYGAKEKPLKTKRMFASFSYYNLMARKHFVHSVIVLGSKGYGVGGVEEILDQALMIPRVFGGWKTMEKKPKLMARAGLCSSQRHGSTMTNVMKSDLPNMVWDLMQANHQYGAPSIDKSHHVPQLIEGFPTEQLDLKDSRKE